MREELEWLDCRSGQVICAAALVMTSRHNYRPKGMTTMNANTIQTVCADQHLLPSLRRGASEVRR